MRDLMLRLWVWKEQKGQTLVEYALLAALIVIVVIGVLALLGKNLTTIFGDIADKLGGNPVQ